MREGFSKLLSLIRFELMHVLSLLSILKSVCRKIPENENLLSAVIAAVVVLSNSSSLRSRSSKSYKVDKCFQKTGHYHKYSRINQYYSRNNYWDFQDQDFEICSNQSTERIDVKLFPHAKQFEINCSEGLQFQRSLDLGGVCFHKPSKCIYVVERKTKCIIKIALKDDMNCTNTIFFANEGELVLKGPADLTIGLDGFMYCCDSAANRIIRWDLNNGTGPFHYKQVDNPISIAVDELGNSIVIKDRNAHVVYIDDKYCVPFGENECIIKVWFKANGDASYMNSEGEVFTCSSELLWGIKG